MDKQFEVLNKEVVYQGFFRMEKYRLKHQLFVGGWSPEISRELFCRGECVGVLLYDPDADKVILIEQFRVGAIDKPEKAWMLEIVAGVVEEGETAKQVAYRESLEEAGCNIEALLLMYEFYSTPGGSSEWVSLYCGKVDSTGIGGIHGLLEEHEDIMVRAVDFEVAYQMLLNKEISAALPIIAIQWLALNRGQLRLQWAEPA
ncbi:MAG: NUDIX domain-containing protein [Methylococcaceae bacterium]|jgi:ADP-ribose pyrophosphatase